MHWGPSVWAHVCQTFVEDVGYSSCQCSAYRIEDEALGVGSGDVAGCLDVEASSSNGRAEEGDGSCRCRMDNTWCFASEVVVSISDLAALDRVRRLSRRVSLIEE